MQVEHEKCLEIVFYLNAQIEPTLLDKAIEQGRLTTPFDNAI